MATFFGLKEGWIAECSRLIGDDAMLPLTATRVADAVHKAAAIKNVVKDHDTRRQVAQKVVDEELTSRQTKQLAEAIAQAPTEQARKKLLEWEYSPTLHHPETVREHEAHSPMWRDNGKSKQEEWDGTPEVKIIVKGVLDSLAAFRKLMREVNDAAQKAKLSPEGRQFVAERLRQFRNELDKTIKELEA